MLQVIDLEIILDGKPIISGVSFKVNAGEKVALVGAMALVRALCLRRSAANYSPLEAR